jgi:ketosteroid isomerase-like protein
MKQLLSTLAIFAVSSVLCISCSNTANESGTETAASKETKSSFDLAAARKTIDSTNAVFAGLVSKGDSSGLASMYTADAKLMGANMPAASGRSAIQTAFAGMFSAMGPIDLKTTAVDIWGDEDMLIEEGTYAMSQKGKEIDRGKYIVLWKMEDGKWKLFRDCFNSDLPPAAPPK